MYKEFVKGTQRYKLKDGFENNALNETTVVFENKQKVQSFIQNATKDNRNQSVIYNSSEKLYNDIQIGEKEDRFNT